MRTATRPANDLPVELLQTITTDAISSNQFRMREIRNGVNIITRNANHTTNPLSIPGTATDIFDNNNNWQAFEHSTDRISYDAHWGAEKVFDFWLTVHNRNSINGSGIAINSYFHFRTNEENAYWFTDTKSMYYGDGGSIFKPLAALDVCAHEFGHGITEFTVPNGGLNKTGEAGALNEGFSDIWGASVEAWAAPNKQRWLIGEEIMLNGVHCLRNIQNPKDLTAREHDPDTYHGTNWDYANEPHQNSTVLSHWYYLISVGGTGTNDIGSIYNVSAIGIDHASKIAYRTEQLLNPSANYAMARTMSIQAAKELYGVGSCEEISVTNAWYAVGIGGQFVNSASISGDNIVCTTSGNYLVNSLPAGATVSWQASPSGVVTINSPNATQTTLTKNNNGVITLTAIITLSCGAQFTVSKQQIVIGPQTSTNIVGLNPPLGVSPGELLELSVMEDGSSYLWEVEGGVISGLSNQQSVTIQVNQCPPNVSNGYINVHVTINNACGTGGIYTESTTVDCGTGGGPFRLMPNPANSIIAVDGELKNKFIKEIKIMDKLGNIKRQVRFSGNDKRITIDVSLLSPDIYYLQVFDGKIWETMQLLIKR